MPLNSPSDGHQLTASSDAHHQVNKNTCSLMTAHVNLNYTKMWNVRVIVPARPWRGRVIMFRKFVVFRKFLRDRCMTRIESKCGVIWARRVCVRNAIGPY